MYRTIPRHFLRTLLFCAALTLPAAVPAQQVIVTIAGTGAPGSTGDGGPAKMARLQEPIAVATDGADNLYIGDYNARLIRMVDGAGIIHTLAGTADTGYSGDGGPATAAKLGDVVALAADAAGNVYMSSQAYHAVRKITTSGTISTIAGTVGVQGFAGDGGPATAARFATPGGLALDNSGNLYVADRDNFVIRKITPAGVISTVVGIPDSTGNTGNGGPATAAKIGAVFAICTDGAGNLYIGESYPQHTVRKVSPAGIITLVAGDDSATYTGDGMAATATRMTTGANGLYADGSGNLYISEGNKVRKVNSAGILSTVAGNGFGGFGGDNGDPVYASISTIGLCMNSRGDLLLADGTNSRVRRIAPRSILETATPALKGVPAVYPNPCRGNLKIKGLGAGAAQATLCDVTGKIVQQAILVADDNGIATLQLTSIDAGVYVLKCVQNGETFTETIILEK